MRLKAILGGLVLAALGGAVAFAAPPPGKGPGHKPSTTGAGCKPQVSLVIRGTAIADAGASTLSLNVTGGNHFAKLLFANNTSTTVNVATTNTTNVTAQGNPSTLTSIKKGDRVLAVYRVCKADVTGTSVKIASANALASFLPTLSPKKVVNLGHGA